MNFNETSIGGAYLIELKKLQDERGFFARTFCASEFEKAGLNKPMVQTNMAFNVHKGTFRGLHMQLPPASEAKLVRCLRGAILDIILDLRPGSPTYLEWIGLELSDKNNQMALVPEGCAHGYLTLEENTEVSYQVSAMYTPSAEVGFSWNDPAFKIRLPFEPQLISEKDRNQPAFELIEPRLLAAYSETGLPAI